MLEKYYKNSVKAQKLFNYATFSLAPHASNWAELINLGPPKLQRRDEIVLFLY